MLARLFVVLVILAAPLAAAAAPAAPATLPVGLPRYVHAELALAQPSLTTLAITGDIYAYRYDVDGDVYDADDMAAAYNGFNKYSKRVGTAFVEEVEAEVKTAVQRILSDSFPDDTVSGVVVTVDRASLASSGGNPYDPPVHLTVSATIERTRDSVGLGDLSDAAVDAAFASGARLQADFTLTADPGYRIVYALGAPSGLRWEEGEGVAAAGATFSVTVDNTELTSPTRAASGRLYDAGATAPTEEDIRSAIDVALGEIVAGATGIPVAVTVQAEVRALDVLKRFPDALPPKVQLPFVNADGIRALRATDAIEAKDIAGAEEALLAEIRADVERSFGSDAIVSGGLSAAELARAAAKPYTAERPLLFLAGANTTHKLTDAQAEDIDLALRIGGTAEVEITLFAANGRDTLFTIRPPSIGEVAQVTGGTVTVNGLQANVRVPGDAASMPATLSMRGRGVPTFDAQDARIEVKVDIVDVDTGVGRALSGDLGNMVLDITVVGNLKVIELPEDMRAALPQNLELRFVSSDGVRLLLERGLITSADLARLESRLADQVREKLAAALGGAIPIESSLDRDSLAASLVATPISADKPIVFAASARVAKPLAGGPVQPQAAIALYTQQLPLTLPKIEGLDTVYTVIAPRGLAITGVTGEGVEVGKAPDGRDQFTATPREGSTDVTVSMAVTPTFVLLKFWPLVLLAVLLLVLVVGSPIALVVLKRRKGRTGAQK
ncbi:MAG TPA: hypothetical protein VM582_03760 [Candidatus Thermoplasmatota archaeon]|nr:hypothetical protein [Candidatus Thermoplasmatota archaeon]